MSEIGNRFEAAAKKGKKKAGGLPEELTSGKDLAQEESAVTQPEEQAPPVTEEPAAPVTPAPQAPASVETGEGLVATYEAQKRVQEPRSVRLQVVITPSVNEKLSQLVKEDKIKSRNDLINYLLDRYLNEIN